MLLKLRGRFIYFLQVGGAIPKMQICFYKIIIRNFKIQLIVDTINQLTLFLKKKGKNKKASGAIEWKCITLLSNEQEYFILILIMQETVTT